MLKICARIWLVRFPCYNNGMSKLCQKEGCNNPVSKPEHDYCSGCKGKQSDSENTLNATDIGQHFGIEAANLNKILNKLGWVESAHKGWKLTDKGVKMKGSQRQFSENNVPYAMWPKSILENSELKNAVSDYLNNSSSFASTSIDEFPANFRTTDGHMVRSLGEALIDNYLYSARLKHVYERKLPVVEDVYSDFYLPDKRIYIEYWGWENDPKYDSRKKTKQQIYQKYKDRFNLIELDNNTIKKLDEYLSQELLKYGIYVD